MSTRTAARRTALAVVLAVTGAMALPAAHAVAAPGPATTRLQDDFNGDGYSDLAVAAPSATVGGRREAGYVAVLYGSAKGLRTSSKQVFSQNTAGVPGTAETGDRFGGALDTADLDRDGYADLVIGAAGEDTLSGGTDSGFVEVVWGGARGLSGASALATGRSTEGAYGELGSPGQLTVGDVDGDGAPDVVAVEGLIRLRAVEGPFGRDGSAAGGEQTVVDDSDPRYMDLAAGDVNGDGITDVVGTAHDGDEYDARRVVYWRGTRDGLADPAAVVGADGRRLQGGESVDLGDVNGDGRADVVVGRFDGYDSDLGTPIPEGGRVACIPGSASGPDGTRVKYLNQDSAGVPGAAEPGDHFGSDVSVADIDGDGRADISVGVPGEDFGGKDDAGSVVTLRGTASGPTGAGAEVFSQDTPGVPGTAEDDDLFGRTTHLVDADHDGRAELVVGDPAENRNAGAVWVFRSTASGVTPDGSYSFGAGVLGTVATGARLGQAFAY